MTEFRVVPHDRRIRSGLARLGYIVNVQAKRVTDAVREKSGANTGREYCGFLRLGFEDTEFLEATHEYAVAKELNRVPMQTWLDSFERCLEEIQISFKDSSMAKIVPFASQGRARRSREPLE
jgi:antitoxin (DNA-binding transcriptional repressor) of toxin-antitoxin stability system